MRILTYNTRGSLGMDNRRSTVRVADTVRAVSPDVVCFQEIHQRLLWSGSEDQPAMFSRLLGRTFVFHRLLTFGTGGYGLGMCVRGAIAGKREHLLPGSKEQRGLLEVSLREIGGLPRLTVFCTHWGLSEEERDVQSATCIAALRDAPRPLIFCGDFNEALDSPRMVNFLERSGLVDADRERNCPTFVSDAPSVRIDGIFYSPDLKVSHVEVVSSLASDHLPLLADVSKA